jgi:hypothetical protein
MLLAFNLLCKGTFATLMQVGGEIATAAVALFGCLIHNFLTH